MNSLDIATAYDQLANVWNGTAFDRTNGIEQHEQALAFCKHTSRALDVGCGSSGRIIELLIDRGFVVEGVDVSPRMIELARRRHPEIEFYVADICDWSPRGDYDFISAWDSVWHVPLGQHRAVLSKLFGSLRQGGICIFSMGGLDHEEEKMDSSMGPEMYYSTLGIPETLKLVARAGCMCRHLEFDQYPEPHVYLIVERA